MTYRVRILLLLLRFFIIVTLMPRQIRYRSETGEKN